MKKNYYTKTEKGFSLSQLARCFSLALIFGILGILGVNAQTTVFFDDFSEAGRTITSGGTPTMTYTLTNNTAVSNPIIESTTATGTVPYFKMIGGHASVGQCYLTGTLSTYGSTFNSTLKSNVSLVTWSMNLRQNYGSGNYGTLAGRAVGVVLVASEADLLSTTCKGYAIMGGTSATVGYQLVKFSGGLGLTATYTSIISPPTQASNSYTNIKVTYNPADDTWSLFETASVTATDWLADPSTTPTLIGSAVDNTNTSVAMTSFGYFQSHSSSGTVTFNYYIDNFKVTVASTAPTLSSMSSTITGLIYTTGSGPSASKSFNLSGTNLTGFPGDIAVAGTTNYEVSTDNTNFSSSVNIPYTSATLSTPVYVRLKSGLPIAAYNSEVVTCTGGGATAVNVTCSGRVLQTPVTYTWNQTGTASVATAANWTPERTTPEINDILQINGGGSVVLTDLTTQSIGQLSISNNTTVELQSAAAATLTIAGATGVDLSVTAGSALNLAQATNAITVAVGTGATGLIAGSMTLSTTAHRLIATDASGITFQNGSSFTESTGFSGNPFGTTSLNSVVFESGSTFNYVAGSNPFAATAPSSVVNFQAGSKFVHKSTSSPSLSGRTYADFEYNVNGNITSTTGSSALTIDNLTVTQGSFALGLTTINIKGNISIASGATLDINPTAAATLNLTGSVSQSVQNAGTLKVGSFSTIGGSNFSNVTVSNNVGATINAAIWFIPTLNNAGTFRFSATPAFPVGAVANTLITSATQYGKITSTAADIDLTNLTMNVALANSYAPANSDAATLIEVTGSVLNDFTALNSPAYWTRSNPAGKVVLTYDTSTGIKATNSNIMLIPNANGIQVLNAKNTMISVYSLQATMIKQTIINNDNESLQLQKGLYIVRLNNESFKIMLK